MIVTVLAFIGALTLIGFGLLGAWLAIVTVARRSHGVCDHPDAGDET